MPRSNNPNVPSALDELGLVRAPWLLHSDYMQDQKELFQLDSTSTFRPLMAMAFVAAYWWQQDDDPPEWVAVPWWAIQAIAIGFKSYENARDAGLISTIGEAFGMEGGGQGKEPHLAMIRRNERDRNVALWVAVLVEQGTSVTEAKAEITNRHDLGDSVVQRAWRKFGREARTRLADLRRCNTSRCIAGAPPAAVAPSSTAKDPDGSVADGTSTSHASGTRQRQHEGRIGSASRPRARDTSGAKRAGSRPRPSRRPGTGERDQD